MQYPGWSIATFVLLLAAALPAGAQSPTQAQANAIRQNCRADYQSHCASVPTGGSAALQCLQQNEASLSAPCRQAVAAVGGGASASQSPATSAPSPTAAPPMSRREEAAMLRADCGPDFRRFCTGVEPGGGRAIECLRARGPQLSKQCRSALLAAHQQQ